MPTVVSRRLSAAPSFTSGAAQSSGGPDLLSRLRQGLLGKDLQRVLIEYETDTRGRFGDQIAALFNPTRISTSSQVSWSPKHTAGPESQCDGLELTEGGFTPTTLSLDLLFDTTLDRPALGSLAGAARLIPSPLAYYPLAAPSGVSVLPHTNRIFNLTQPAIELHRPPVCRLWWGQYLLIQGVLSSLNQEFTRFLRDGTPVRANLSCTFTRTEDPATSGLAGELNSADVHKVYVVRRGDSLTRIAAQLYGDPLLWRPIALENGIQNPRALRPGTSLRIPRLR